jgi:hypothetical protein
MASTRELLQAGIFLAANTMVVAIFIVAGGPIFGSLSSFVSGYSYAANNPLKPELVQWIPGFFFTLLLIVEILLIIRLAYVLVSKTDYSGEQEW